MSATTDIHIVGVATKAESSFNADFCNLAPLCEENHIPYIYAPDINAPHIFDFIESCAPDVIYCLGWSSLIKEKFLTSYPIIGYHPTALPHNRGRHPIIWALALGLDKSASSFFLMDKGADSGDIISQVPFDIAFTDNAASVCEKVEKIAQQQIYDFTTKILALKAKNIVGGGLYTYRSIISSMATPQEHTYANLWRKRGMRDDIIDFRMSALGIYNLIRALSKPYVGAEVLYNDTYYKVWEAKIIEIDLPHIESGKILKVDSQGILVKAYDKGLLLTKHELNPLPKEGSYF